MDCAGFEKWLFENPKEKTLPADAEDHLNNCPKCSELWKIEAVLLEAPANREKLFFPPQMRNYLVPFQKRSGSDAIPQGDHRGFDHTGRGFRGPSRRRSGRLPRVFAAGYFQKLKPYIGPVVDTLGPFCEKILSVFQVPGGIYLFAFMVFAATLSFEVYYKTVSPKHSSRATAINRGS